MIDCFIYGIDHIKIHYHDLRKACEFYTKKLHFFVLGRTKNQDAIRLQHSQIRIVLVTDKNKMTTPDGLVTDIAFLTSNIQATFEKAMLAGVTPLLKPHTIHANNYKLTTAIIETNATFVHSLIERESQDHYFLPGFLPENHLIPETASHFSCIDHLAICVPINKLNHFTRYYETVYGFSLFHTEYVAINHSGMNSKVMVAPSHKVKLVFVEPISKKQPSQIINYLTNYGGTCVQHIAISSIDIVYSIKKLIESGMEFLSIPQLYYDLQAQKFNYDLEAQFKTLNILYDRINDNNSYLFQAFTKNITNETSLFFEIIQRINYIGFTNDNITTLFKAIEQDYKSKSIYAAN